MSRSKTILALAVALGFLAAMAGYAGLKATAAQLAQNSSKNFTAVDRKSTRLNSSHIQKSRMPSSA